MAKTLSALLTLIERVEAYDGSEEEEDDHEVEIDEHEVENLPDLVPIADNNHPAVAILASSTLTAPVGDGSRVKSMIESALLLALFVTVAVFMGYFHDQQPYFQY